MNLTPYKMMRTLDALLRYNLNTSKASLQYLDSELDEKDYKVIGSDCSYKGKALYYLGFNRLFKALGMNTNVDPYVNYMLILNAAIPDLVEDISVPSNRLLHDYLDNGGKKPTFNKKIENIFNTCEYELMPKDFMGMKIADVLGNYKGRRKNLNKRIEAKEKTALKYLSNEIISNSPSVYKYRDDKDLIPEMRYEDVMNPVIYDYRENEISLFDYDRNDLIALIASIGRGYIRDTNTQHISSFIYYLLLPLINKDAMFIDASVKMKLPEYVLFVLVILDIESRLFNCDSIAEYLEPVIEFGYKVSSNYTVIKIEQPMVTNLVCYRCGAIIFVDDINLNKVLLDKGITSDDKGVAIYNNKPLWYHVFPIYEPKKGHYNNITMPNRGKSI